MEMSCTQDYNMARRAVHGAERPWRVFLVTLTALLCVMCVGCERSEQAPSPAPSRGEDGAAAQQEQAQAPKLPQWSGIVARSEALPARPMRIVSLAPNITETLFALGAGERLVGVTRFCDYPPQAKTKTPVGGFIDPDMEKIISLKPDLVVGMSSGQDPALAKTLGSYGLSYVFVKIEDITQTLEGITFLGQLLGEAERGQALSTQLDHALKAAPPAQDAPRVLLVFGHKPLIVAGPGSFGHELIERAGGVNAAAKLSSAYPSLELEQVLTLNPTIIVDMAMAPGQGEQARAFWGGYESLAAVKAGQVHVIEDASMMRPGPRLEQALARFKAIVQGAERQP